ncbi:hypothetical protein BREU_2073 [Bifidobacterium reuteri DSM 23975]|uniref:Uncharacterized protein n=1 Tax=Bifidobacterium reuteri DSM 23975 TaxID=1437610 RepID=A0A087CPJ7_9BIFI|nr:hypothetical protein BREU_2073 [Bifidobacterium reuteri DSM 23975]
MLKLRYVTSNVLGSMVEAMRLCTPSRRHASPTVTSNDAVKITSSGLGSYHGLILDILRSQNALTNDFKPPSKSSAPMTDASATMTSLSSPAFTALSNACVRRPSIDLDLARSCRYLRVTLPTPCSICSNVALPSLYLMAYRSTGAR